MAVGFSSYGLGFGRLPHVRERFLWCSCGRPIDEMGTCAARICLPTRGTWRPLPTGHSPPPCSHHRARRRTPLHSLSPPLPPEQVGSLGCNGEFSMGGGPPSCSHAASPRRLLRRPRRPRRRCRGRRQGKLGVPGGRRVPAPLPPDLLETQVGRQSPYPPFGRSLVLLVCRLDFIETERDETYGASLGASMAQGVPVPALPQRRRGQPPHLPR